MNSVFENISYYFLCEILDIQELQQLDEYELELGFYPVWISLDKAIKQNESLLLDETREKNDWVDRETEVLKIINMELMFVEPFSSADEIEELIKNNEMVLIYFGNNGCGVCKVMKPKVEVLLQEYPNVKSAYIDTDNSLELSASYNIFSVPAILVFTKSKEIIREARHISLRDLDERINRYYNLMFE